MKTHIEDLAIVTIPKVMDNRGSIAVVEKTTLPFDFKRIYYLYNVPAGSYRGGHAHKTLFQCLIALNGSFDTLLRDGKNDQKITLNNPEKGLLIPPGIWCEIGNFSAGAICLVLASEHYIEADYIRNYREFLLFKRC